MGDTPRKNGRKKRDSRARKRKHHGNQHTIWKRKGGESTTEESTLPIDVIEEEIDDVGDPISASARKIQPIIVPDVLEVAPECNVIMNTSRLIEFFQKLIRCPECNDNVIITHGIKLKYGLAHFFKAKCCSEICDWSDSLLISHSVDSNLRGRKSYEIYLRACMGI